MDTTLTLADLETYIDPVIQETVYNLDVSQLELDFGQTFLRPGFGGTDPNMYRKPGNDAQDPFRVSRPMMDYHEARLMDRRFSMRFPDKEPRVKTRPQKDWRQGMIVPDFSIGLTGSPFDLYDRRSIAWGLSMLALRILENQRHPAGLILPNNEQKVSLAPPFIDFFERQDNLAQPIFPTIDYTIALEETAYQYSQPRFKYLVLISDFLEMDEEWRTLIKKHIVDINQSVKICAWQIVSPWDMEMSNQGRQTMQVNEGIKRVNTAKRRVRENHDQEAKSTQRERENFFSENNIAHSVYYTDKPFVDQIEELFDPYYDRWPRR